MNDKEAPARGPRSKPAPRPPEEPTPGQGTLRERVLRQRRHIEDLSGQDPLRGGIDD